MRKTTQYLSHDAKCPNRHSKRVSHNCKKKKVLMAVIVQIVAFWVVTPCSLVGRCSFDTLISAYKTKWCHKPKDGNLNMLLLQQHVQLYFRGESEKDHADSWPKEQISGREARDFENATQENQSVAFCGNSGRKSKDKGRIK
jgi:hypothetical protein